MRSVFMAAQLNRVRWCVLSYHFKKERIEQPTTISQEIQYLDAKHRSLQRTLFTCTCTHTPTQAHWRLSWFGKELVASVRSVQTVIMKTARFRIASDRVSSHIVYLNVLFPSHLRLRRDTQCQAFHFDRWSVDKRWTFNVKIEIEWIFNAFVG